MNEIEDAVRRWLFALPDPRTLVAPPDDASAAAALDERRRRVARLYRDGIMSEAEYDREKATLQRDLARIPASESRREEMSQELLMARAEWDRWGDEARRAFIGGLVEYFIVEEGDVTPVWRPSVAAIWEGAWYMALWGTSKGETGLKETDVYSIDGHLIGKVTEGWASEYASSRSLAGAIKETGMGYFRMTGYKGGDLYVPLNAMSDYTDERLKLRFTKAQVGKQGWDKRPSELGRD